MLGKGSGSYFRLWSKLYAEEESRLHSDRLKYASRLSLGYWLHNLPPSPARQCSTANLARLGQVLPPAFEAERHGSGGSLDFSVD